MKSCIIIITFFNAIIMHHVDFNGTVSHNTLDLNPRLFAWKATLKPKKKVLKFTLGREMHLVSAGRSYKVNVMISSL